MPIPRLYAHWRLPTLAVTGALVLSGCAVDKTGCDPASLRTAGFLTKLSCDVSGSYDARAQDQQVALTQAQARNEMLQGILTGLESESRELQQGLTVERSRRDRLVRSINQYLNEIDQQSGQSTALEQQITQARAKLDQLAKLPASATAPAQQARLAAVQKEIETLRAMTAP